MVSTALGLALGLVGPVVWAVYSAKAVNRSRAAEKAYAEAKRVLVECNAELLRSQMSARYSERQAVTCNASVYRGTEAPV